MTGSQKRSTLVSALLHGAAILLVLTATSVKGPLTHHHPIYLVAPADVAPLAAPHGADAGGGGGQRQPLPATRGDLPRRALREFVAPMVVIENPHPRRGRVSNPVGKPATEYAGVGAGIAPPCRPLHHTPRHFRRSSQPQPVRRSEQITDNLGAHR